MAQLAELINPNSSASVRRVAEKNYDPLLHTWEGRKKAGRRRHLLSLIRKTTSELKQANKDIRNVCGMSEPAMAARTSIGKKISTLVADLKNQKEMLDKEFPKA